MKILLFGKNGQVGWELNRSLLPLGELVALGRKDADLSNPESLRKVVREIMPDVIVNAAAYTAVDKAEEEEELATIINGVAPGVLAEEAKKLNALLVHYSTDYVFDGKKDTPYSELDKPNPINAYGRSKLAGEESVRLSGCDYLILRTSWVYSDRGDNFLLKIIQLASEKEELSIVDDQIGAPTCARLIADSTGEILLNVTDARKAGIFKSDLYNLSAQSCITWFEFANKIIKELAGGSCSDGFIVKKINSIRSDEYKTAALRPHNSCLSVDKIQKKFKIEFPPFVESLKVCIGNLS